MRTQPQKYIFCNLSDNSKQPTHIMCWGAHDEFTSSFICFPQFIGSVKFFAIKHQLKVSMAFASNTVSTAIHTITVQYSLRSTSLSDVSRCLTVTVLSQLLTRSSWEITSGFHSLPRFFGVPQKWQLRGVRPILSAGWSTTPYKLR